MNSVILIPAAENCGQTKISRWNGRTKKVASHALTGGSRRSGQPGFTLVEMLSVMGIIALLCVLVVPAFKSVGSAGRVDTVGNQLADLAGLARQNSLAKNCLSALVLLTDAKPTATRQAAAVFQLLPRADGAATTSADWTQVGSWQALPPGVCVDVALTPSSATVNDPSCTFQDAASQDPGAPISLPSSLNYSGSAVSSYKFVVFLAGGGLLTGSPARVELVEGTLPPAPSGTPPPAVYTHPLPNSSNPVLPANYYRITLIPATGRAKIDRP